MKSGSLKFTIIVCVTLFVMQTVFMIIPHEPIRLYNMALRPLIYATLAVMVYVFMGLDKRPVRKGYTANITAVVSVAVFGIVFLAAAFLFGAGANIMTQNSSVIARNVWQTGVIVILGELIRFKLIRSTSQKHRAGVIFALTVVLAYAHMNAIRLLFHADALASAIFFESIFKHLVISAVASYFAAEGSFLSVVLVSFVYTMAPYLIPIMPDISPLAWTLITCGLLFITAIIYRFITNERRRDLRAREKREAKAFAKRPVLGYSVTVVFMGAIVAFFAGLFPVYPVVVLTDSMEGTLNRGSLAFVERVPHGEAYLKVGEGEVIHFLSRTGAEYIHRVVDFRFDADGQRQYITRGDANYVNDPFPVRQKDVLGVARAQLPFLGYPYIFVHAVIRAFG